MEDLCLLSYLNSLTLMCGVDNMILHEEIQEILQYCVYFGINVTEYNPVLFDNRDYFNLQRIFHNFDAAAKSLHHTIPTYQSTPE